jgi:tetratricopeptide (TPR) repeat protein
MSRTRLTVIILSVLVGTVLMAVLIVPLNLTLLRGLTGERVNDPRPRVAEVPVALPPPRVRPPGNPNPRGQKELDEKALRAILDDLGHAIQAGDAERIGDHVDAARMLKEFQRAGALRGLNFQAEAALVQKFKTSMAQALARPGQPLVWKETEIRSVKFGAGGDDAVAVVRHRDGHITLKMRWWATQESGSWKVYDFEDLDTGLRVSDVVASLLPARADLPVAPPAWVKSVPALQEAVTAIRGGDFAGAERALNRLDQVPLPGKLAGVRWLLAGAVKLELRDSRAAQPCLDKARGLNPDMPCLDLLYAALYNQTGKPAEALKHLEKYRALLGDDAATFYQLGLARAQLGQPAEAIAAYRKCLDDQPNALDGLLQLRRVLPHGQKAELAKRFARVAQGELHFEQLALDALTDLDAEAVEAYVSVLRGRNTNDPVVDLCEARAKALAGKVEPAAALFQKAMATLPDGQARKNYVREFLIDLAEIGNALRAYRLAPDRREAFPVLAQELFNRRDAETLRELITAHQKAHKEDPWAQFYTGELHADAKEYEQADRAYAAAQAGATDEQSREQIRSRRVFVRCQAGKGLSAYDDIGPRGATLAQLAGWFAQRQDGKRLAALVAAHRRNEPGDPKLPLWEAEAAWLARDHAGVVRLLQKHRDDVFANPANRFNFTYRLLYSLAKLGRFGVVRKEAEALVRSGAADREPLRFALSSLVHERQTEAVTALAAALRAAAPEDPEGLVWQARAEILKGDLARAGTLLRSALGKQPQAPVRDRYLREFLFDTVAVGKSLDGYRQAPDPDGAFRTLGDALLGRFFDRSFPGDDLDGEIPDDAPPPRGMSLAKAKAALRQLIQAHREKRPDDPAADLYEGELHLHEGDSGKSVAAFARGMARKPSEALRQRFHHNHVLALYQAGKGLSAYTDFGRDRQTFNQLANLFFQGSKAKELEALIAAHRQTAPNDPTLPVWETDARFLAGDYAAALKLLEQHRGGAFAQPGERWRFQDRRVLCLVRLKRFDEALKEARAFAKGRDGNLLLPAVVHAAAGDVAKTEAELAKCVRRFNGTYAIYNDPDLVLALSREPSRALRQRFPEHLPLPLSERGRRLPGY